MRCSECRFWVELTGLNDLSCGFDPGTCHRYPPIQELESHVVQDDDCPESQQWTFPCTMPDDWCGEFSPVEIKDEPVEIKDEPAARNPILDMPVSGFVNPKIRSSLRRHDVKCIGDLVVLCADDLLEFRNFGEHSLYDIRKVLAEIGLCLKGDEGMLMIYKVAKEKMPKKALSK